MNNLDLLKVERNKYIESIDVVYNALSQYSPLAFSKKEARVESEWFLYSLILAYAYKNKMLNVDILKNINDISLYKRLLKPLKLKKVVKVDDKIINYIIDLIEKYQKNPKCLQMASYFDKLASQVTKTKNENVAYHKLINSLNKILCLCFEEKDYLAFLGEFIGERL